MDELGPDEQRWLDVLRAADEPNDADRARVRASALAIIASAGVGVTAGTALGTAGGIAKTAGGVTGTFAVPWKLGIVVVSLVLAGSGGVAAVLMGGGTTISAPAALAPASVVVAAPAENRVIEAAPVEAPVEGAKATEGETSAVGDPVKAPGDPSVRAQNPAVPHAHSASSSQGRADDVDGELLLLTQAQQALKRGDPNTALQALARHRREYPRGALAVEREGLRAIASCDAKRSDGRTLAERFVAQNPNSPLVARARTACLSP